MSWQNSWLFLGCNIKFYRRYYRQALTNLCLCHHKVPCLVCMEDGLQMTLYVVKERIRLHMLQKHLKCKDSFNSRTQHTYYQTIGDSQVPILQPTLLGPCWKLKVNDNLTLAQKSPLPHWLQWRGLNRKCPYHLHGLIPVPTFLLCSKVYWT